MVRNGRAGGGQTKKSGDTGAVRVYYYIARATVCQYNARRKRIERCVRTAAAEVRWRWERGGLVVVVVYALFTTLLRHCSAGNLSFARKNDYSRLNGLPRPTKPGSGSVTAMRSLIAKDNIAQPFFDAAPSPYRRSSPLLSCWIPPPATDRPWNHCNNIISTSHVRGRTQEKCRRAEEKV